ncbi:sensor histidine kinase [Novosphingobium tardum]|uniref:histidine kinase n=1 Tax=Novosphingobium tardum TaxID=1538021 RepID=A0ABV8RQI1_9SPHN
MTETQSAEQAEQARLAVLRDYGIEGLRGDPRLTGITDLAAALCDAPVSLVSLVEDDRQWFAATTGSTLTQTPRDVSFCAHALNSPEVMEVPDARADPRFADNALVTGEPHIRFYAGAPLRDEGGSVLGTLCVIDGKPRTGLAPAQRKGLQTLADAVMTLLAARKAEREGQAARAHLAIDRDRQEQAFRVLADTMPQMVWSTQPDGYHDYYNARWYEFTGLEEGSTDGDGWNDVFHPDDQERAWTVWRQSLETGDPYEIEYRLRAADGSYRWVLGRALPTRDGEGRIVRWFGTCTDIQDHKAAMEQREIISHELSHRIKNIFSVIGGLIGLSSRRYPEIQGLAEDLRGRVMALGRAHDFVRPHSENSRPARSQTSLQGMLEDLLSAYQDTRGERVRIVGDDAEIDDQSATPLALLFHELATNAAKYGALSVPSGRVEVGLKENDGAIAIDWREIDAPERAGDLKEGFGSQLIEMAVRRQLGGTYKRDWTREGLHFAARVPATAMRRS